jgi:hypothetical protein
MVSIQAAASQPGASRKELGTKLVNKILKDLGLK